MKIRKIGDEDEEGRRRKATQRIEKIEEREVEI
jgi:hypothetical protein